MDTNLMLHADKRWRLVKCLFGAALVVMIWTGIALSEVSQVPLFLTSRVDPNVLFLIDDSGSMQFEIMPDDYTFWGITRGSNPFVFPRYNNVYGSSDYTNNVVTVDNNAPYNALARSPQFNKVYYDPSVTYLPWVKSDKTRYPDASPSCALHSPERSGTTAAYCRNLTANNSNSSVTTNWRTCSGSSCSATTTASKTFWPATYFFHNGGDRWSWNNYTKVEIRSTTSTYSGHGRQNRTDCAGASLGVCTYAEEIQNFANWYTYYRSRILSARAAIGQAFVSQPEGMRVGFGSINSSSRNIDGRNTRTLLRGVRPFSGTNRDNFYDLLYGLDIPAQGTPLRKALDDAGQYYSWTDNRGPWGNTPGTNDTSSHLSCRQSYTILMTDGYWTEGSEYQASTSGARSNNDGTTTNNMTISNPDADGAPFNYVVAHPFRDNYSNTLADVAMYYWKRDLCPSLPNRVPVTPKNPAFWQHMVTYGVGLGVTGSIDPDAAWKAIETGASINWPDPTSGDSAKLDDLLHAAVNSRGGYFSAADPDTFAKELTAALDDIVARGVGSAAAIAANSTRLSDDTYVYQARFFSTDWSGQMVAYKLNPDDGSLGSVKWDTDDGKIPAHGSRKIITSGAGAGQGNYFTWDGLTVAQRNYLISGGTEQQGKDRLNWLRGRQDLEVGNAGGYLRKRSRILGDIVNSDPVIVAAFNFRYQNLPEGVAGRDTYLDFVEKNKSRRQVIYVGANDGMLHAFDAESGAELFAYVPNSVYDNLAELTAPDYDHQYYVDGSPFVGDVYIDGEWKTVLVGTLGAGGRGVFALDVTDPDNFGPSKVLWDISYQNTGFGGLGYLVGQPTIGRMQNGSWAAVFGNGYGSGQPAQLYVVDIKNGARIDSPILSTGVGSASDANGLATPACLPDKYRTIEAVYAGDLQGNLWKFDLSDTSVSKWGIAYGTKTKPQPLFTAKDAFGTVQPITAPLEIGIHAESKEYMVFFGTGKYFEAGDNEVVGNPPVQSFYAVRDDGKGNTKPLNRSSLVKQEILAEILVGETLRRVTSKYPETTFNGKSGWYMDLISPDLGRQGERVVTVPFLRHGRVLFTTLLPSNDPCEAGGHSWLMELMAATGNRPDYSIMDINGDGKFDSGDLVVLSDGTKAYTTGARLDSITKLGSFISMGDKELRIGTQSDGGVYQGIGATDPNAGYGRRAWRQLR